MKTITIIICGLLWTAIINAQIIYVPADQSTIQAGIDAATNGDTVLVAEGTYLENINFLGKAITVASHFILDADTNHINNTIIDGSQPAHPDSASVVYFISGEDTTSVISGFIITGGTGTLVEAVPVRVGGGVFCYDAGAKISHNHIEDNHVSHLVRAGGGGIGCRSLNGEYWVVIEANSINDNSCSTVGMSAHGAGIYSSINSIIKNNNILNNVCDNPVTFADGGGIELEQSAGMGVYSLIKNNIIQNNALTGYRGLGAGILIAGTQTDVIGNTISQNFMNVEGYGDGGGVYLINPLGSTQIIDNDISGNIITSDYYARGGGLMYNNPNSQLLLSRNTINYNKTYGTNCRGGGVMLRYPAAKIIILNNEFIGNSGSMDADRFEGAGLCLMDAYDYQVIIDGNIFKNDTARLGGGFYSRRSYNMMVTNNMFVENYSLNGGGIEMYHYGTSKKEQPPTQIINNTFFKNYSNVGGAMYLRCEINVPVTFNNIFFENQSPQGNDIYLYSCEDTILIAYSNIDPVNILAYNSSWLELANINENPGFIDNLCHIDQNSPCVDSGIDSIEYNGNWYYAPDIDFEGTPRPFGQGIDIGADEYDMVHLSEFNTPHSTIDCKIFPNPVHDKLTLDCSGILDNIELIDIYNTFGAKVAAYQINQTNSEISLDVQALLPGLYFLRLQAGNEVRTGKVIKL